MKHRLPTALLTLLLAVSSGLASSGCKSAWERPVPEPLPEDLAFRVEREPTAGVFFGLRTAENDSGSLEDLFFQPGVKITHVVQNSPAATAGVAEGDVLLSVDGTEVSDPAAVRALEESLTAGGVAQLELLRGDTAWSVELPLVGRSGSTGSTLAAPERLYRLDPARSIAGWSTAPGGVRLVSSRDDAPFPRAGIALGSTVTALDGEPVLSDRDLVRKFNALEPGTAVDVSFTAPTGETGTRSVRLAAPRRRTTSFSIPVLATYSAEPDGSSSSFVLLDLYLISLFRYERDGREKTWRFLRFFEFGRGTGELDG